MSPRIPLLWLATCVVLSCAHRCIHDAPHIQAMISGDLHNNPRIDHHNNAHHGFVAMAPTPLRVIVSTTDLDESTKFCSAAGQNRSDFTGGIVICRQVDVLTLSKKSILVDKILPTAIKRLADALSIQASGSNIVVPQGSCGAFTVPASHSTTGVANADYVLYVAAGPTSDETLAWAGACVASSTGRMIVGRANFGPSHIEWSDADTAANEQQVATAVHELMHALGLSNSVYRSRINTTQLRGKTARILTGVPTTLSQLRTIFNCPTLQGVELEDESADATEASHLERRVMPEEIMTATAGTKLSPVSLGLLQDLGGYVANFTVADALTTGVAYGCGFHTAKCNTTQAGRDTLFCFQTDATATRCTSDLTAIGYCDVRQWSSPLPAAFSYFSNPRLGGSEYMDGCPIVRPYANRVCTAARSQTSDDIILGELYSAASRCFASDNLIMSGYAAGVGATGDRCIATRCSAASVLQVQVGSTGWRTCSNAGQALSGIQGYTGSVTCPDPTIICGSSVGTSVSPTSDETYTPRPSLTPSPGAQTITGQCRLSGKAFNNMSAAARSLVASGLVTDIANALSLSASNVAVTFLSADTSTGTFSFVISGGLRRDDVRLALNTLVNSGGRAANAEAAYASSVPRPDDQLRISSATVDEPTISTCSDPKNFPDDMCLVYVAIGVVGLIIVVCVVIIVCLCVRHRRKQAMEPQMIMVGPSDLDIRPRKTRYRK
jgi:leishmanolysin